jgi:hypothetical protein
MISAGFLLLVAVAAVAGVINYLLGARVEFPVPPGSDHISEGPFSKATRLRARYWRRAAWSLGVCMALLIISSVY